MNKKILFLILLTAIWVLPIATQAQANATQISVNVRKLAYNVAMAIVVIGWVIVGTLFLTGAGNPEKTKTARTALVAAVIGTVAIAFAGYGYNAMKAIVDSALQQGM